MTTIENVTGTAFVVAEFRAEENAEARPMYMDPVVSLLLTPETRRAADRIAAAFPEVKDLVKVRTRYLDDMLDAQLRAGVRQVVILGAGLDTRCVRKAAAGVSYFEIEDMATLAFKQSCYALHRLDVNAAFIPGNYVTDGLIDLLAAHQFDFDLPTYVIWEGNTMYLSRREDLQTLGLLRRHIRQFQVSFDYMSEQVIANTTGDPGIVTLVRSFRDMGAPWQTGFADVAAMAEELNLEVIGDVRTCDLWRRYRPEREKVAAIFDHYAIATLGSRG